MGPGSLRGGHGRCAIRTAHALFRQPCLVASLRRSELRRWIGTAIVLLAASIGIPAQAHFNLNINIRIAHIEHLSDGLRVYLRIPAPYVLAPRTGSERKDGTREPAPFTTNRIEDGQLMHYLDIPSVHRDPEALGRMVADGHEITVENRPIPADVLAISRSPGHCPAALRDTGRSEGVVRIAPCGQCEGAALRR